MDVAEKNISTITAGYLFILCLENDFILINQSQLFPGYLFYVTLRLDISLMFLDGISLLLKLLLFLVQIRKLCGIFRALLL